MLVYLKEFPEYVKKASKLGKEIKIKGKVTELVVAGMGGSGISGNILGDWLEIPVRAVKDYRLPKDIGKGALLLLISYSGNTEETLSVWEEAKKRKLRRVAITSGGKLAGEKTRVIVPEGMPPRAALPWLFFPILNILKNAGIVKRPGKEVKEVLGLLKKFRPELAKGLAERVHRKTPVIYSSGRYRSVLERWKDQINENSKALAITGVLPEIDHNELTGHSNPILRDHFHTIFLRDPEDNPRVLKRMELTAKAIRGLGENVTVMNMPKGGKLARIFSAIYFGDWFSYYLGRAYRVDVFETVLQESLKKELSKSTGP